MYRFFCNQDNVGDVLFLVIEPETIPNRVVEKENTTLLYRDETLVGANFFGLPSELGIHEKGMLVKTPENMLSCVNQRLEKVGESPLTPNLNSGYLVAKVLKLEEHPLDERCNIVTLDIGGEEITTVSRYTNLKEGLHIVVAIDGCIKFDGTPFHKKVVRNIPIECEVCSPFDLRVGEEGKSAFEAEGMVAGIDFFA